MDSSRDVLNLPMPEVLAYFTTSDNPIGAEYILMERVEGESLASRWLFRTTETSLSRTPVVSPQLDRVSLGRTLNQPTCCLSRHHGPIGIEPYLLSSFPGCVE
jgi:aminoglycoside phosphotransferase (APT) family kinase protein